MKKQDSQVIEAALSNLTDEQCMVQIREHVKAIETIEKQITDYKGVIKDLSEQQKEHLETIKIIAKNNQGTGDSKVKVCKMCGEEKSSSPELWSVHEDVCASCYPSAERSEDKERDAYHTE